jgi:hypothetical protein
LTRGRGREDRGDGYHIRYTYASILSHQRFIDVSTLGEANAYLKVHVNLAERAARESEIMNPEIPLEHSVQLSSSDTVNSGQ